MITMTNYLQWEMAITNLAISKGIPELYPEQKEILKNIFETYESKQNIFLFSAPPACGKSLLIALVAIYLSKENIALVVPFTELKTDFEKYVDNNNIDVMTLNEYIQSGKKYDIVMIDEAHNISSFIEYDSNYVKNMRFFLGTDNYDLIKSRFLKPHEDFHASRLHAISTKWILDNIYLENRRKYSKLIRNLSEWICFLYISEYYVDLKFVHGNISNNFRRGLNKTYMFSATPLNSGELEFYCNIRNEEIGGHITISRSRRYENRVNMYEIDNCDTQDNKIDYITKMLDELDEKTLILFKSQINSQYVYDELLNQGFGDIFHIKSGMKASERANVYQKYVASNNSVLLTASSVFWEGINIKSLKIVILYEVPYPRPNVIDLINNKINYKNVMKRRIIQGVGRVGRKNKDVGLAILLFNTDVIENTIKINSNEKIPIEMKTHLIRK